MGAPFEKFTDMCKYIVNVIWPGVESRHSETLQNAAEARLSAIQAVNAAAVTGQHATTSVFGLVKTATDAMVNSPDPTAATPDTVATAEQLRVTNKKLGETISSGVPDATESTKGKAAVATTAEAATGADDTKFMTPKKVKSVIPLSLPANGGNADTVDGKHAVEFTQVRGAVTGAFAAEYKPGYYEITNATDKPIGTGYCSGYIDSISTNYDDVKTQYAFEMFGGRWWIRQLAPNAPQFNTPWRLMPFGIPEGTQAAYAQMYTGASDMLTDYPIGDEILVYGTGSPALINGTAPVYVNSGTRRFTFTSGSALLSGTWRARGSSDTSTATSYTLMRRIA